MCNESAKRMEERMGMMRVRQLEDAVETLTYLVMMKSEDIQKAIEVVSDQQEQMSITKLLCEVVDFIDREANTLPCNRPNSR